ncbi:MAG: hypothetical protein ACYTGZ_10500 [Planctomycetota bacterium]|jgi:hypothetical protein
MRNNQRSARGALLVEVLVSGALVATAAVGAAAALISGLMLEAQSERSMSEVATAENLIARMRYASAEGLGGMAADFHEQTFASRESSGYLKGSHDVSRELSVSMAMDEATVPGGVDLDGDGLLTKVVDPADARLLVIDVAGADKFRLRTAMLNFGLLRGVLPGADREKEVTVEFGETLPPPPPPEEEEGEEEERPPPIPGDVWIKASALSGREAVLILENVGLENRIPVTITIAPNNTNAYFEGIHLDGEPIFTSGEGMEPGTATVDLVGFEPVEPGTSTLNIGDFFTMSEVSGRIAHEPGQVVVTIWFDDGTGATVRITED